MEPSAHSGSSFSLNDRDFAPLHEASFIGDSEWTRMEAAMGATGAGAANARSSTFVVAIAEGRGREVGIAAMDVVNVRELLLSQVTDSQSFAQTLALLETYAPAEVLVAATHVDRVLSRKVVQLLEPRGVSIVRVARRYYSDTLGFGLVERLAIRGVEPDMTHAFLPLSCAAALLKYVEHVQSVRLAPRALVVRWQDVRGRVSLDFETVRNLELITNARTGSQRQSLFGVVDRTKTAVGARLLRATLLCPSNDLSTVNARLDAVDELLHDETRLAEAQAALARCLDLDLIASQLVQVPKTFTPRTARQALRAVIALRHCLALLPELAAPLEATTSHLLAAVHDVLTSPAGPAMRAAIDDMISEGTAWSKSALPMRQYECFAVRPGVDGLLDVARKTYLQSLNDIHALVDELRGRLGMPALQLRYTETRGFHLFLPGRPATLPDELCQATQMKQGIACSTDELLSLNERNREALTRVYVLTNEALQGLLGRLRDGLAELYKIIEAVALLDMLQGFAVVAQSSSGYVRPSLTAGGALVLRQARHPAVERLQQQRAFVPNDAFLGPLSSFVIVTGCNCSGKSTFLKQVAIVTILALAGCYVPADFACVRLVDRIFTRIGTSDNMEQNASTFVCEMRESAYILEHCTERSLVIIDELGRGTSFQDGFSLAWAIAEQLIARKCPTLFATHFHHMSGLTALYPGARIVHFDAGGMAGAAAPTYKLKDGELPAAEEYGIQVAAKLGMPPGLVDCARRIRRDIQERMSAGAQADASMERTRAMFAIAHRLLPLAESSLSKQGMKRYLQSLRVKYEDTIRRALHGDGQEGGAAGQSDRGGR